MLDFDIPSAMPNHMRDEEELRLLAIAEACHSDEIAASDLLTHPVHSLVFSEYRLVEALRATRLKSYQSRIALREHKHRIRQDAPPFELSPATR